MHFERIIDHKPRELNLVPLINVVFLLLIFFLVTSTISQQERITVDVPLSQSSDAEDVLLPSEPITIAVDAQASITVNGVTTPIAQLAVSINRLLRQGGDQERVIKLLVSQTIEAEDLVDIMEYIRKAGGVNISLITQSK